MIEKLVNFISPPECLSCGSEGRYLCGICESGIAKRSDSCLICNKLSAGGKTCKGCYAKTNISGASVSYIYDGIVQQLIHTMKYDNSRGIARFFGTKLSPFKKCVVTFVPADGSTRRRRGFDQSEILAKSYAKANGLEFRSTLIRQKHIRQVGAGRAERIINIKESFMSKGNFYGEEIIIVDDVITTGSTIVECARVLKNGGAKKIWAVAIARG